LKLNQLIAERSVDRKKFTESKASLEAIIKELGIDLQKSKSQYVSSCSELQIKLDSANQRCHEVESLLEEQQNLEDPISANPDEDSIKMISSLASQLHESNMLKHDLEIKLLDSNNSNILTIHNLSSYISELESIKHEETDLKLKLNMEIHSLMTIIQKHVGNIQQLECKLAKSEEENNLSHQDSSSLSAKAVLVDQYKNQVENMVPFYLCSFHFSMRILKKSNC
jgi:hypothetical protein